MELVVNDKYEDQAPSPEAVAALFEGQWVSALPGIASGDVPLFSDDRIQWAIDLAGGVAGKRVLELGPLEGGHTYMLDRAGAASIRAIEANTLCYLKCLLVQQLFGLDRTRFELGNFVPWLNTSQETFDVVIAAGVLYHLSDPVPVLDAICRSGAQVYLWTHYLDLELMPVTDRRYKRWFVGVEEHEYAGRPYPLHRRVYKKNPTSDPKFIGGVHTTTAWIEKQTILDVFETNGFDVEIAHEADNHSGPSASFFARKRG
jgi:SAM-dependent methyltransferase